MVNWLVDNPNIQFPPEASDAESGSSYDNCSDSDLNPDDDFEDLEADYEQVRVILILPYMYLLSGGRLRLPWPSIHVSAFLW